MKCLTTSLDSCNNYYVCVLYVRKFMDNYFLQNFNFMNQILKSLP